MSNTNNPYCLLKYACSLKLDVNPSLCKPREKYFFEFYQKEFYVEEYNDFKSLVTRINSIYDSVIQGYTSQGIDKYSDQCSFPEFFAFNRFGEYLQIGVSTYGWKISMLFFNHLNKHFENKYGAENGWRKASEMIEKNEVYFYWDYKSEPLIIPTYDLVSEETAHIILQEFLDTGKTEFDTDFSAVYEHEIAKRNY